MTEMLCRDCDAIVEFVQPVCEDGLDEFDLMCVVCGTAITFGGMLLQEQRETLAA
ncbi:MAG: hypothetical protein WCD35_13920 [Mycobacteriales bacterium]